LGFHFNCTQCANCCHHTKVPITVSEAIDWLRDNHQVQVICEASPWMPPDEQRAEHLLKRSFAAQSGSTPLRVVVTLVANLAGNCPNLEADGRCGIYERRPLVCRIYPAETNPFVQLDPQKKACPPEAWASHHPLLERHGRIMSSVVQADIQRWRESNVRDIHAKRELCDTLKLLTASIAQEGFFIHSPPIADLLQALSQPRGEKEDTSGELQWRLVADRDETLRRLVQAGASASHPRDVRAGPYEYIGLQPA
jgi:Fe-S-cluster containining protein